MRARLGLAILALVLVSAACVGPAASPTATPSATARPQFIEFFAGT